MSTISKFIAIDHTPDAPLIHSTLVSVSQLQDGTNACSSIVNTCSQQGYATTDNNHFSLLLTNIDTSVTEWDIRRMVARALDLDPDYIDATKLVPFWKTRHADFISFKIVLENRWKNKAMNSST